MVNRTSVEKWIVSAAAVEASVTGLVLLAVPTLFSWLILGTGELTEAGQALGRLTGIAMIGVALATWSVPVAASRPATARRALTIYNLLATIYLAYLGIEGHLVGILLWPAVALHAILLVLLGSRLARGR